MSGMLTINGEVVKATHFAYDGCHKIYLIGSVEDAATMAGYGYDIILPVSELAATWEETCFLRFINWADLGETVVPQAYEEEPTIEWRL